MSKKMKSLISLILAFIMSFGALSVNVAAQSTQLSESERTIINVLDFGADPSGIKDSTVSVQEALQHIKDANIQKATLYFPKGEYHFWWDYALEREIFISNTDGTQGNYNDSAAGYNPRVRDKRFGILIEDMNDLIVDGGGSLFLNHGPIGMTAIIRSKNIVLRNFDFDHFSPHVVDLTVIESNKDERTATFFVPPSYKYNVLNNNITFTSADVSPINGKPYWTRTPSQLWLVQKFYTDTGIQTERGGSTAFSNSTSIQDLGNNKIKITYNSANNVPNVGICFEARRPNPRETAGILGWESENITLKDMKAHFLYGFGMVFQLCKDLTVDTVNFAAREGTGRYSSSFADHLQVSSVGGKVEIVNCLFTNPHDDPINIHGTYLQIKGITRTENTTELLLQYMHNETAGFPQYYAGDEIDIAERAYMSTTPNCVSNVLSVVQPGEGGLPLNQTKIVVDKVLPNEVKVDTHAVENITYTPEVLIKGNRFIETVTRGILVTTRRPVVIEDNYFDAMGMASIFISCDAQGWYESGPVRDVTIRNNIFDRPQSYGIFFEPTNGSHNPDGSRVHENVLIEGNTFNMTNGNNVLNAKSVDGLVFKNNTINRYNPNVNLTLSASEAQLKVGESKATTLNATGTTINGTLYNFNFCNNVTIENNIYDSGFNQKLNSGGNTPNIEIISDDIKTTDNQKPAMGSIYYVSSNPSVLKANANGTVAAVGEGEATVYAYTVSGSKMFESNKLTFTVSKGEIDPNKPEFVTITCDNDVIEVGETTLFNADSEVNWTVRNALTREATNNATIDENGNLTATSYGIFEVIGTSKYEPNVFGSKLLIASKPSNGFSSAWGIDKEVKDKYSIDLENNSVTVNTMTGGWWAGSAGDNNTFYTLPKTQDFEATVKMTGKTNGAGGNWEEAGLVIYKDGNNYVAAVRKNGGGNSVIGMNFEVGGSPAEKTFGDVANEIVWFKIVKAGNSYSCYYSLDGETYTQIDQTQNVALTGTLKAGFFAGNAALNRPYKFEDFTINGEKVPFAELNNPPTAENIVISEQLVAGGAAEITYDFIDQEGDEESNSIYRWYVSNEEDGNYALLEQYSKEISLPNTLARKYIKAQVVPVDEKGAIGNIYETQTVLVGDKEPDDTNANLESLILNGIPLEHLSEQNIMLPPSLTAIVIEAATVEANANVTVKANNYEKTEKGNILATINDLTTKTIIVSVTAVNGTKKEYIINLSRIAKSDALLEQFNATGVASLETFDMNKQFYNALAAETERELNFNLSARDENATVQVIVNNEIVQDFGVSSKFSKTMQFKNGSNIIQVRVRAEDGNTEKLYRFVISWSASNNTNATAISIGGNSISDFSSDKLEYTINKISVADGTKVTATLENPYATYFVTCNGKVAENGALKELEGGLNTIVVAVVAEDRVTIKYYKINVILPDDSNADLVSLNSNLKLSPEFSRSIVSYTAQTTNDFIEISAQAMDNGATIDVMQGNTVIASSTSNKLNSTTVNLTRNRVVKVIVKSRGGSKKEYTITVEKLPQFVYLSDLNWIDQVAGWSGTPNRKDLSCAEGGGNPIALNDNSAAPNKVVYEKGLGGHAGDNTKGYMIFPIPEGYTHFKSLVGVTFEQINSTASNINFQVFFGNSPTGFKTTPDWESGEMNGRKGDGTYGTFKPIDLEIPEGSTYIKLKLSFIRNDASGHGNWADAKFVKIEQSENSKIYVSSLEVLSNKNGYDLEPNQLDKSIKNNPITLNTNTATPTPQVFEKGLGMHASMTDAHMAFAIPEGYTHFRSLVGIAYGQIESLNPNVNFKVQFGTSLNNFDDAIWESGEMNGKKQDGTYGTFKEIDLKIPEGATHIKLSALGVRNINNSHANWADAKFVIDTNADERIEDMKVQLPEVQVGNKPEEVVVENTAQYIVSSTTWKDSENNIHNGIFLPNKEYSIEIVLQAKSGFKFTSSTSVPNGYAATISADGYTMTLTKTFQTTENKAILQVVDVNVKTGENTIVKVNLLNNPGITGAKFRLKFDKEKITPVNYEISGVFATSGSKVESNMDKSGIDLSQLDYITFVWVNSENVDTIDSEIVSVEFAVNEMFDEGDIAIEFEEAQLSNYDMQAVDVVCAGGNVSVNLDFKFGDIDEDGKATTKDFIYLMRYLADWGLDLSGNKFKSADVIRDGKVNTKDLVRLCQYLSGWNVELGSAK